MSLEEFALLIRRSLERAPAVEIDGLGIFARTTSGSISFQPDLPRIFIAYAVEDSAAADRLFTALSNRGFATWLDRRKLLPGQNWPRRIEDAIANSDFFIACFSSHSVGKRGGFQAELRFALDCAKRIPLDDAFIIPVRLDECQIPARIQKETQYIDLFPDWCAGLQHVFNIIEAQTRLTLQ